MFEFLAFAEYEEGFFCRELEIKLFNGKIQFQHHWSGHLINGDNLPKEGIYAGDSQKFINCIENFHPENWTDNYVVANHRGHAWSLTYKLPDKDSIHISGCNKEPENFGDFKCTLYGVLTDKETLENRKKFLIKAK